MHLRDTITDQLSIINTVAVVVAETIEQETEDTTTMEAVVVVVSMAATITGNIKEE